MGVFSDMHLRAHEMDTVFFGYDHRITEFQQRSLAREERALQGPQQAARGGFVVMVQRQVWAVGTLEDCGLVAKTLAQKGLKPVIRRQA